jgi:hypothetical protein
MGDILSQTRLSLRLDAYMDSYNGKGARKDTQPKAEWDNAWKAAQLARTQSNLTPELVDDVRVALNKI